MKQDTRSAVFFSQIGAAATEFAMILVLFMGLIIGVVEFARMMYIYSTAVEATRLGARYAAVCSKTDEANIKARMKWMLPALEPENITISYPAPGCSATTCDPITVSIHDVVIYLAIPLAPLHFTLPSFSTSVPSESLDSTNNPVCSAP